MINQVVVSEEDVKQYSQLHKNIAQLAYKDPTYGIKILDYLKNAPEKIDIKELPKISLNMQKEDFVNAIYARAKEDELKTGIPAAIMAAQAILESTYGSSALADKGNNLFGMTGSGTNGRIGNFAAYNSIDESIQRYERNLMTNSAYKNLFELKTVKEWAYSIGPAGYCPEKDYGDKIWRIIQDWGLE